MRSRERVVWDSEGTPGARAGSGSCAVVSAGGAIAFVLATVASASGVAPHPVHWILGILGAAFAAAVLTTRDRFSLTPTRLVLRLGPAGRTSIALDRIIDVEPRGGDRIALSFRPGLRVTLGPVRGSRELAQLLREALVERTIDLDALPGLADERAPAEERGDIFVAAATRIEGAIVGPLVIGPTRIIHFARPLDTLARARLLTELHRARSRVEAEAAALETARAHLEACPVVVDRSAARARIEGPELCFESDASVRDERCIRLTAEQRRRVSSLLATPPTGPFR